MIEKYLQEGRPRAWICRELGVTSAEVWEVAKGLGYGKQTQVWNGPLEDYDALEQAVEEDWPLNEMTRTFGRDYRYIKKWFPNAGWKVGGGREVQLGNERRAAHRRRTNQTYDRVARMSFGQYKSTA